MKALVTGGGRGIGRAIALRLAQEGFEVTITARSKDQLDETVALSGGLLKAIVGNVADRESVERIVSQAGPVNVLVNNAATAGPLQPFAESDPEEWWRSQEVNLRGPMLFCRAVLPGMIGRRSGRILNVVSGAGTIAIRDMSAYVVSKTALIRFSEQLAAELAPHGITVFALSPGMVRTAMLEDARTKIPLLQKMLDDGAASPVEKAAQLAFDLATGKADVLSGRLVDVREDLSAIVADAEAVKAGDLRVLRLKR